MKIGELAEMLTNSGNFVSKSETLALVGTNPVEKICPETASAGPNKLGYSRANGFFPPFFLGGIGGRNFVVDFGNVLFDFRYGGSGSVDLLRFCSSHSMQYVEIYVGRG